MGKADLLCFLIQLKHREVIDIAETVSILLDQIKLFTKLGSDLSCIKISTCFLISNKENGISGGKSCQFFHFYFHIVRNKFIDRSLVAHIFHYLKVTKSAHSDRLCKLQKLFMEALGHLLVYFDGSDGSSLKRLESTSLEELCHIDNTKWVTKIRFVGTELQHSLFVADDRIWCLCNGIAFRCKFFKSSGEHFFSDCKYIFLCCKAHFKIELVKFTR